jgi:predicted membrane metal-binding protein
LRLNPGAFASAADAVADGILLIAGVEVRDVSCRSASSNETSRVAEYLWFYQIWSIDISGYRTIDILVTLWLKMAIS